MLNQMTPHTVERYGVQRNRTRYCLMSGCLAYTRNSKDYCSEHVEHQPYVQGVLAIIAEREAEQVKVNIKGWRAVDVNGSIAQEIWQYLSVRGKATIRRVAKDLGIANHIQTHYVEALRRAGMVKVTRNQRNIPVVQAKLAA